MKAKTKTGLLAALLGVAFATEVCAQLPNAWQIDDDNTGAYLSYTNILNAGLRSAATNYGFDFSVNARFVTNNNLGGETMIMIYGDGTKHWEVLWSLDVNGDLLSDLIGGNTYTVTADGTGTRLYHTHEIIYNPTNGLASYLVDGRVMTTNWAGSSLPWPAGQMEWGAGGNGGVGTMNFHSISFIVTNGLVAGYDAGTEPSNAPDPSGRGWSLSPSVPPLLTSTNSISPDSLPGVFKVTTLADGGAGSLRQLIASTGAGGTIAVLTNGVIALTQGELLITNDLTIIGPETANLAIDAGGSSRLFEITNANVGLAFLTLTNGHTSRNGGGIVLDHGATLMLGDCALSGNSANNGGGIGNESGDIITLNDCTLSGNVATNSGGGVDTALGQGFLVQNTLYNCTLSNNSASYGGGIAASDDRVLGITNCTFAGNFAAVEGGGVYILSQNGPAAIYDCTFSGNYSISGSGGAIINIGAMLTLYGLTVSGNSASYGGGIANDFGTVALYSSTLSSNSAAFYGGGIEIDQATTTIFNSILSGNSAAYSGGGIRITSGLLTIHNSTFSGNSASTGGGLFSNHSTNSIYRSTLFGNSASYGGGIYNGDGLILNSSTLFDNSASANGGGIFNDAGGLLGVLSCTLVGNTAPAGNGGGIASSGGNNTRTEVNNSIIAGNGNSDADFVLNSTNSFVSYGYNLVGTGNALAAFNQAGDLTNMAPLLAPPGNYGGPTQTMPPLFGSPAIDDGNDAVTNDPAGDQRGYPRKSGAHVDIGAVEAQYAPANNPPHLMNAGLSGPGGTNSFQFTFTNVSDADFTVLASTNLALPLADWLPIGNAAQNPPGQYQFTDPGATNYPQRFYRVVSP